MNQLQSILDYIRIKREVKGPQIPNHGKWEVGQHELQFECSHAVFPEGNNDSLCYTTSEERAQWITEQLRIAATTPALLNALEIAVQTFKQQWDDQEMGYIIDGSPIVECGLYGAKTSKVSDSVIHEDYCEQGKLEQALSQILNALKS